MSTIRNLKKYVNVSAKKLLRDVQPDRCGELRRQQRKLSTFGLKKWRLCYVVLYDDCLFVFDDKNSKEEQFVLPVSSFKGAFSNDQVDIDDENVCFTVQFEDVKKNHLIFACDVEETRQKWVKAITEDIKKFSADSENENNYIEIDESKINTNAVSHQQTKSDESGRHKKNTINTQNTKNAYSDFPHRNSTPRIDVVDQSHEPKTVAKMTATGDSDTKQRVKVTSGHTGQPCDTKVQLLKSIQPDSDQQNSGFINVGIHSPLTTVKTPYTCQEGMDNDGTGTNVPCMQFLKVPVPESNSGPENTNESNNDENSQNIYENMVENVATYSNVDKCLFEQTKHCTSPSTTAYWAARQTTKPKVAISPTNSRQRDFPYHNSIPRIVGVDQSHDPKTVSKVVATGDSDTRQRVKMASRHTGQPYDTIIQQLKSKQTDSDQQDSGFINVGILSSLTTVKTLHTRLEGVDNDGTSANTPCMQNLKVPVPESNSEPENTNALNNDGNSQNIYENTDFATYSNVDECFSIDDTKHCTSPSAPVYGAERQTTKPKVATKPTKRLQTDLQQTEMATQSSSMDPVSVQQDSANQVVCTFSSSTEAKTPHETHDKELNEGLSENIHLRLPNLKLQRSESRVVSSGSYDSNSSEESTIYENTDFDKAFERDDYICELRKFKHLMSEPIGTFCVRPGKEQELAVKTVDGIRVFRIHEQNGCLFLNDSMEFQSLDKLLSFYSLTELPSRTIKVKLTRGYKSKKP